MASGPGVYVTNLREVRRWFATFEPDLTPKLRESLKKTVERTVIPEITRNIPTGPAIRGHASSSVRAVSGGNRMYVRAGGAKFPYFGWLDFGGKLRPTGRRLNPIERDVIKRGRFIYPGLDAGKEAMANELAQTIQAFINTRPST